MTSGSDGGADSGGEPVELCFFPYPVVNLAEGGAGSHPSGLADDGDVAEVGHVEDEERDVGGVRNALVVVAAASRFQLDAEGFGAEDGGLDVGLGTRRDHDRWFGGGGSVETSVSDVGA